jgi:hypothetical protein
MVPPLTETLPHDTEFDLDVRLQAVAGEVSLGPRLQTGQNTCACPSQDDISCPPQCGPEK